MHPNFHRQHFGRANGPTLRRPLPLAEHPFLDIDSDFAFVAVVPTTAGEDPFLEISGAATLGGDGPTLGFDIQAKDGTTSVRIHGAARAIEDRITSGRFWEANFWEKRRWHGHFRTQIVAHVPRNVRMRIRSAAARVHVEQLAGCDLSISTNAGALFLEDVVGRLALTTEAGRIDGRRVGGTIDASTSAGAISLEILSLDPGTHRIRTNMGAARVDLAQGMPVQIDTRTAMGSSRVDFRSIKGAAAILELEADLGAIRVRASRHRWDANEATTTVADHGTPYRAPGNVVDAHSDAAADEDVKRVLERVADGTLAPADARELLRAMGWG